MEVYYSKTTISAPKEVQEYLDYLAKVAACAKILGIDKLFNDAKSQFNNLYSEWDVKVKDEVKRKRTWYDRLWGNEFYTFVHLSFSDSVNHETTMIKLEYDCHAQVWGEDTAKLSLMSRLKDMLDNPERHIGNNNLFGFNVNPFGRQGFYY